MGRVYEHVALIDSRDADGRGHCRPSALLGHLQEAATQAAEHGGFGRKVLLDGYNGFWMLTRMWFRLERPLRWGEEIMIRTWHRQARGVVSYRDYDLFVGNEFVGEGVSAWVLADGTSHKLMRLGGISEMADTHGDRCKDMVLSKLKSPGGLSLVEVRRMRYSDTDINGHVNNTRYADFACDALEMDQLSEGMFLAQMQIGYLSECRAGQQLEIYSGKLGDDQFYVCGAEGGKTNFEAALRFEEQ